MTHRHTMTGLLVETQRRKNHRAIGAFREVEEKARREDALAVLVLVDEDGRRYVVAPYEPAYLEVLLHKLRQAAAIAEANRIHREAAVPSGESNED